MIGLFFGLLPDEISVADYSVKTVYVVGLVAAALVMYGFMVLMMRQSGRLALAGGSLREGRVTGVTGLMGGGKSTLTALYVVRPWLKRGRTIIANFGIDPEVQGVSGEVLFLRSSSFLEDILDIGVGGSFYDTLCTCKRVCDDHSPTPAPNECPKCKLWLRCSCRGVKLVIDEAQVFIPSNNSASLPIELKSWITLTRKNHIQVVWVAQSHKDVHAMLRRLTTEFWICTEDGVGAMVAQRFRSEAGEIARGDPTESIRFRWSLKADGMFNSWEIIIPAKDVTEMAGKLSRKYIERLDEIRRDRTAPTTSPTPESGVVDAVDATGAGGDGSTGEATMEVSK